MKIVIPKVVPTTTLPSKEDCYALVETAGRICYKSEKLEDDTTEAYIGRLIKRGHLSVLEHVTLSLTFLCDRGITHEVVRHRIASYSQESTRYCNYSGDKFGREITVVDLATGFHYDLNNPQDCAKYEEWMKAMEDAEEHYMNMLKLGATPQEARSVLPNSTKTEIVVTMDVREWRHFFNLRYFGVAGVPHPQMMEVAGIAFDLLKSTYPAFFNDLKRPE